MKKRIISTLLLVILVFSLIPTVYASASNKTTSEIRKQITDTYSKALKASGRKTFNGYCAVYVRTQLSVLGIYSANSIGNGNKVYNHFKNINSTSSGYNVIKEPGANAINNLISKHGQPLYNIVVSYPRQAGATAAKPGAGHTLFIHAIINDTVYWSESSSFGKVAEGGVLTRSVKEFNSSYKKSNGDPLGAIYFTKDSEAEKNNTNTPKAEQVNYFPKYSGSTVSIVTALQSVGAGSSYDYRAKIAAANGISGYSGTAAQNTRMLNLLKAGTLVKP